MIKINFDDTFDPIEVAEDFSFMTFNTTDKKGVEVLIKIQISSLQNPLLPYVSNLAFGPLDINGKINDSEQIYHQNKAKVFSTILFFCLAFLQQNSHITIGLDGSDEVRRAYLYHRMFLKNKEYPEDYFIAIGVDWYVRLLRNNDVERDSNGYPFFKPKPEPFNYSRVNDLYRYYMFHLRQ